MEIKNSNANDYVNREIDTMKTDSMLEHFEHPDVEHFNKPTPKPSDLVDPVQKRVTPPKISSDAMERVRQKLKNEASQDGVKVETVAADKID